MAGRHGPQGQGDRAPPSPSQSLLPPEGMCVPEAPGPWDTVSIASPCAPAGPEIAHLTRARRRWPWNYMQMAVRAPPPAPGRRRLGAQTASV